MNSTFKTISDLLNQSDAITAKVEESRAIRRAKLINLVKVNDEVDTIWEDERDEKVYRGKVVVVGKSNVKVEYYEDKEAFAKAAAAKPEEYKDVEYEPESIPVHWVVAIFRGGKEIKIDA